MQYYTTAENIIVKIQRGEACLATLTTLCRELGITNASFTGIGAAENIRFGYYHLDRREYEFHTYDGIAEVLNVTGNIFPKDGTLFAHTHGTFGEADGTTFGGHVDEMTCAVTLEVILTPLSTDFARSYDEETGLYLIDIPTPEK